MSELAIVIGDDAVSGLIVVILVLVAVLLVLRIAGR